jgi:hypothetical protein
VLAFESHDADPHGTRVSVPHWKCEKTAPKKIASIGPLVWPAAVSSHGREESEESGESEGVNN